MDPKEAIVPPDVVEKLVRHFSRTTGVRVILDYEPGAMPRTLEDGTVILPAWMKKGTIDRLLAATLHESGHVEFDGAAFKAAKIVDNAPGWFSMLHNVVLDARIDGRRLDQYGGARSLYRDAWAAGGAGAPGALRILKTAMSKLIGIKPDPEEEAEFQALSNGQGLVDYLGDMKGRNGPFIREIFELLVILGKQTNVPPPASKKPSTRRNDDPQDMMTAATYLEGRLDKESQTKTLLMDSKFRRAASLVANDLFGDFHWPAPLTTAFSTCHQHQHGGMSPTTFESITNDVTIEDVKEAKIEFLRRAVRRFVETSEYAVQHTDIATTLDLTYVADILTAPEMLLCGEVDTTDTKTVIDIVVDGSGSMSGGMSMRGKAGARQRFNVAIQATIDWIKACTSITAKNVDIGTLCFGTAFIRATEFTPIQDVNHDEVRKKLAMARGLCGGGTDMAGAVRATGESLEKYGTGQKRGVVIITDGEVLSDTPEAIAGLRKNALVAILAVGDDGPYGTAAGIFQHRATTADDLEMAFARALLEVTGG
jgi:hypothetical protein